MENKLKYHVWYDPIYFKIYFIGVCIVDLQCCPDFYCTVVISYT